MRLFVPLTFTFVLILLLIMPTAAHVPILPGDHNSLDTAVQLKDPSITYAIYGTLHEAEETDYYKVTLQKDAPLRFMISTPVKESFAPWLVIAGPGISPQGAVPTTVELPDGDTAIAITGMHPLNADYEPFTPIAGYQTAMYEGLAPATGTYIIAAPNDGGPYTLATGTLEAFTVPEWVIVPINQLQIRLWQEQSPLLIFGPYLVVMVIGIFLFLKLPGRQRMSPPAWLGFIAGLIYIGTGAATLLQTSIALQIAPAGLAVLVTLVFVAIVLGAGVTAVSASVRLYKQTHIRFRILMVVIGIVGLIAWAGVIVGPVLAFMAAIVPARYL